LATFPRGSSGQKLLEQIESTESWLDQHVRDADATPAVANMVKSLRRYLRHCRRGLTQAKVTEAKIDRWRERIDSAFYEIWGRHRRS